MTARPGEPGGVGVPGGVDERLVHDVAVQVLDTARRMLRDGLVVATSGNVSARVGDLIVVTPTGVPYDDLAPGDLPVLTASGEQVGGRMAPTSETPLHLSLYNDAAREPAAAIVHTHSTYATAVSTLVREVPAVHYVLALCGGPVRVADYATYGTPELAANVRGAMAGRTAALMANHGSIAVGHDLAAAYERVTQLEWACRVYLIAAAAGTPALLPDGDLEAAAGKLATYGQPPTDPTSNEPTADPSTGRHFTHRTGETHDDAV